MEKALVFLYLPDSGKFRSVALLVAGAVGLVCASSTAVKLADGAETVKLSPPTVKPPSSAQPAKRSARKLKLLHGIASWYGGFFDGRQTASGEIFDKDALTACHPTLPFGTLVRVINLRNRKSVVVRINDRGNLNPGRIIDLSTGAATRLGILRAGLAQVRLEILAAPAHG